MEGIIEGIDAVIDLLNDTMEEVAILKRDNQMLKEMMYLFCKRQTIPIQTLEGGQRKMVDKYINEWRAEWIKQMEGGKSGD